MIEEKEQLKLFVPAAAAAARARRACHVKYEGSAPTPPATGSVATF